MVENIWLIECLKITDVPAFTIEGWHDNAVVDKILEINENSPTEENNKIHEHKIEKHLQPSKTCETEVEKNESDKAEELDKSKKGN